jgi:glycosyltransferase involved in cell wall biosynthesis
MKFCLIAPGEIEIPPRGQGAVESIIWDYAFHLRKRGHDVCIVNERNPADILRIVNDQSPDVCHCHYDHYYDLLSSCECRLKIMTSHHGQIRSDLVGDDYERWYMTDVLPNLNQDSFYNFCLDSYIYSKYASLGFNHMYLRTLRNGARSDLIQFTEVAETDKSVCLGEVCDRKRQFLLNTLDVDLVGRRSGGGEDVNMRNYIGEWTKSGVYSNLTKYSTFVLLSESEAAPLVILEAMMAGLGVVISEQCTANLDVSKEHITVIPESKIHDSDYIRHRIMNNKEYCRLNRTHIRTYACDTFDYDQIVDEYLRLINAIF